MLDEHLFWNDYVRTIENKIAKNTGLYFLNEDSLKTIFLVYLFLFELCKYFMCGNVSK